MTTDIDLRIYSGDDAHALLGDGSFTRDWQALHAACSWSTPFQSTEFLLTWFDCYRSEYQPVIIVSRDKRSSVNGLMMLASNNVNSLQVAGTHHAEYQVWLEHALPDGLFLSSALRHLAATFPFSRLRFRYVPKNVPLDKIIAASNLSDRASFVAHQNPVWEITSADVQASLRKKSNKSRNNRLKRLGQMDFEKITDTDRFEIILDKTIPYYDARQGANNDSFPFADDDLKKRFHTSLFQNTVDFFHVTATTIDDEPIAIHVGVIGNNVIHLAIVTHSPKLSKLSPGKLHLLRLGEKLAADGEIILDLTPGADPWKERFATSHETVFTLDIYGSRGRKLVTNVQSSSIHLIKTLLSWCGITPARSRDLIDSAKRIRFSSIGNRLRRIIFVTNEYRVYEKGNLAAPGVSSDEPQISVDEVSDLLLYEQADPWKTKQLFLRDALRRLENGEHVYTIREHGKLVHYGWLIEKQSRSHFTEVAYDYEYPDAGTVLYDFYTHPEARGRGFYQASINKMLNDAQTHNYTEKVYISCLSNNHASRHVIEKNGFLPICSIRNDIRFGRRSWSLRDLRKT